MLFAFDPVNFSLGFSESQTSFGKHETLDLETLILTALPFSSLDPHLRGVRTQGV
jgi:hypothetical protein